MQQEYIESIEHDGVVESVDVRKRTVTVKLHSDAGCGSCPAASLCKVSGDDVNTITIETPVAGAFRPGDKVVVSGTESLHRRAIMLATVLPCIALIVVMVLVWILTMNQLLAVICGLAATILFFIGLWVMRDRIAHEFRFNIRIRKD